MNSFLANIEKIKHDRIISWYGTPNLTVDCQSDAYYLTLNSNRSLLYFDYIRYSLLTELKEVSRGCTYDSFYAELSIENKFIYTPENLVDFSFSRKIKYDELRHRFFSEYTLLTKEKYQYSYKNEDYFINVKPGVIYTEDLNILSQIIVEDVLENPKYLIYVNLEFVSNDIYKNIYKKFLEACLEYINGPDDVKLIIGEVKTVIDKILEPEHLKVFHKENIQEFITFVNEQCNNYLKTG